MYTTTIGGGHPPTLRKRPGVALHVVNVARLRLTQTRVVTVPTWQATIVWREMYVMLIGRVFAQKTRLARSSATSCFGESIYISRQKIKNTPAIAWWVPGGWLVAGRSLIMGDEGDLLQKIVQDET